VADPEDGSRVDALLERIAPYRNATVMLGIVGLLLFAFQLPEARPPIAHGLMYGLGPLLAILAWTRVRDASPAMSLSWLALSVLVCSASAYAAHHGIVPGEPESAAELREVSAVHEIALPDEGRAFRLRVRTDLGGREHARVKYRLYVSRGDDDLRLRGELYREVREESGGGGPPQRTLTIHTTEHHDAELGGRGPAAITLLEIEDLRGALEVGVYTPFGLEPWWLAILGLLLVLTVALEVLSALGLAWTPLTTVTGLTLVLGEYVALRYDLDQPLITFLGGAVFSGVVGGIGGLVLGLGATWLTGKLAGGNGNGNKNGNGNGNGS